MTQVELYRVVIQPDDEVACDYIEKYEADAFAKTFNSVMHPRDEHAEVESMGIMGVR